MKMFFFPVVVLSALFVFCAFAAEHTGVISGLNPANGPAFWLGYVALAVGSPLVSPFSAWLWGWGATLASLAACGLWHWAMYRLITALIQAQIDRKNTSKRSLP
jgi:hypothetical protein